MTRILITSLVLAVAAMAASCSDGGKPSTGAGVPMFGGDPAHTGIHPGPGIDGAPQVLWKVEAPGEGVSPVAVVDGTIYASSYGGYIFALNTDNGKERWQTQVDSWRVSPPAVVEGSVYVASGESLYALDADNGKERWRFPLGVGALSSPAVVDGTVYIGGGEDGNVYAVDAATGEERWHFPVAEHGAAASVAVDDGVVYADGDPYTWALDAATGEERWHFKKSQYTDSSSPAVAEGVVFLGNVEFLYAIDAARGEAVWHAPSGNDPVPPPAVANGLAYFARAEAFDLLSAFDAATGDVRWRIQTGDDMMDQPVVVGDTLYVGGRSLYALDAKTGEEFWHSDLDTAEKNDGSIFPTVVDGVIYAAVCLDLAYEIGCEEGNSYVYAISGSGEPWAGEKRLTPQAPAPTAAPTATPNPQPTTPTGRPQAAPPILIDGPGVWTLRDLGYSDIWLDRNSGTLVELQRPPISRRYSDPVRYALPPGASQGPDLWYKLHLHFEVILKDDVNPTDKGVQEFDIRAVSGVMAIVMADFSSVWEGDRLVVDCGPAVPSDCPATETRDGDSIVVKMEMWWYPTEIPNVGVTPGVNALHFVIPYRDLPPRFVALHVFDDTYIEVSTTSPYENVTPPPPP